MSVGQNKKKKQKKPAQSSWLPRKEIKMGMFLYCIKMRLKKNARTNFDQKCHYINVSPGFKKTENTGSNILHNLGLPICNNAAVPVCDINI